MNAGANYRVYLLRLWRVTDAQWRASLEDPHTGERQAFATLEQLLEYLIHATQFGFVAFEHEKPAPAGEADVV
jgi:hypothetical protein